MEAFTQRVAETLFLNNRDDIKFIEEMFFDQKFGKYEININIFSLLNTLGALM